MKLLYIFFFSFLLLGCGKDGEMGPQGEKGLQGQKGIDGINGSKIYSGKSAPAATIGVNGDLFLNLSNGDLYGPKTLNGWGQPFNLKGAQGIPGTPGTPGATILSGNTAPLTTIGKTGDFYINQKEMVIYGPKSSSSWGEPVSLKSDTDNGVSVYVIKPDWSKNFIIQGTTQKTFTTVSDEYTVPAGPNNYLEFYTAASDETSILYPDISLNNWKQLETSNSIQYYIIPSIRINLHFYLQNIRLESIKTNNNNNNPKYKFTMAGIYPDLPGGGSFHARAVWIMIKSYNYQDLKAKAPHGLVDTDRFFRIKKI